MSYADPQSVTINAVPVSMPRTSSGTNSGVFTSNDSLVKLSVSHSYGARNRRVLRLDHRKVAADPLLSGVNNEYTMAAYVVLDTPKVGYTVTEAKQVADALVAYLTASSGAQITKLLGGEN